jgi:hypothetical protein
LERGLFQRTKKKEGAVEIQKVVSNRRIIAHIAVDLLKKRINKRAVIEKQDVGVVSFDLLEDGV